MTTTAQLEKIGDDLRARIDEMSTGLLLDGSLLPEPLLSVAAEAEENCLGETANLARSLAAQIRAHSTVDDSLRLTFCSALTELRLSLEPERIAAAVSVDGDASLPASTPASPMSFAEDPELISDFLVESREHLASIESQMLALEKDPGAMEVIHHVFRTFHTIKGLAGFLEFEMVQAVAHEVENVLDRARNHTIVVSSAVVDVVLESGDYLKEEMNRIERHLTSAVLEQPADNRALIERIRKLVPSVSEGESITPSVAVLPPVTVVAQAAPALEVNPQPQPPPGQAAPESVKPAASVEGAKSLDPGSVRVETAKLDHLLEMVGEMVIAQSLIRNNPVLAAAQDVRLVADIAQLSRNTAEVQRTTMSMRMIPIGQVFQRTARLIRDLSRKAGKQIVLETAGEETQVDKTIAEELGDPLLHMVRNSVDHGIESPQERAAAGKSAVACIRLKAYHQAGQIVIEISDDGKGLNREKIQTKAVQNGLIEDGAHLSDSEVYQLIFEPGFSTAEKVTDVSGRGVGMDVVRRNVQKLRGRIETRSTLGEGTTFLLKLPLTLAIIEGLVVVVGSSRYIIPLFAVREMFRPTPELLSTVQGRHEMALVRGSLLPMVRLHRRFGISTDVVDPVNGVLVVAECNDKHFCLLVDDLVGKQEVVIKSLGETFKDVSGLAGCAILGDGRVGLILDMEGIYRGRVQ